MAKHWLAQDVLDTARGFQQACVLVAGAELELFDVIAERSMTARELAQALGADLRAVKMLADALTAMELLSKQDGRYALQPGVADTLTRTGAQSVLAMAQHMGNCMRSWSELARVVKSGRPAERCPSIRGPEGDLASFIEAMNDISRRMADSLIEAIGPMKFRHLLDLAGGPGTWTIAFLKTQPQAKATLFDLPDVIPIAREHIATAGLEERVNLVGGNFKLDDALPAGADLAWVSAIVHMNSRVENREMFGKVHRALADGGKILIRDVVMAESRIQPVGGAMFAINMLVNTPGGGTFTFAELREDLQEAGFSQAVLLRQGEFMDSIVQAGKS